MSPNTYTAKPEEPTVEFHSTPQLWVAYYCGCSECPKGHGITETAAVLDLLEQCDESFATNDQGSKT